MHRRTVLVVAAMAALLLPFAASAADSTIKVGFPMALSGPAALYGQPVLQGARDVRGGAQREGRRARQEDRAAAARHQGQRRRGGARFARADPEGQRRLPGGLDHLCEEPAVSTIAKENKIVFVAPMAKTIQLTDAAHLHPYVNRIASTTDIEGRAAAIILAKWAEVKRVATIAPDYAYGRDVMSAFIDRLKKLRPDIEIVDQQWPKLGQADFTPFITAQMSKQPDAVFSALCSPATSPAWSSRPSRWATSTRSRTVSWARGETGSIEDHTLARSRLSVRHHREYLRSGDLAGKRTGGAQGLHCQRVKAFTKDEYGSSWPIMGYVAMQALVEGIKQGGQYRRGQGRQGDDRPDLRGTVRSTDPARQGPHCQPQPVLGQDRQGSGIPVRDHGPTIAVSSTPTPLMN